MNFKTKVLTTAKLLVVDDEENNIVFTERLLRQAGYAHIHATTDSRMTMPLYDQISPDLVLLDLHMPEPNGFQLLEDFGKRRPEEGLYVPILVLTADIAPATKLKTLGLGASDFLTKPIERCELLLKTRNLLETRFLYRELTSAEEQLEQMRRRASEAEEGCRLLVERLEKAGEYADFQFTRPSN